MASGRIILESCELNGQAELSDWQRASTDREEVWRSAELVIGRIGAAAAAALVLESKARVL